MLRGERKVSFAVRKPTPVKKVSPLKRTPIKKTTPAVKGIHRVKRAVKSIVRPFKVAPVVKPPSAIKKIAKIVLPVKKITPVIMPRKTISTTPSKEVRKKAVITSPQPRPVKRTIFTPIGLADPEKYPIAIERERREVIKAVLPKIDRIEADRKDFVKKFAPRDIVKGIAIDMRVPFGKIAPAPKAMPPTKKIGKIIPKVLKKVTPIISKTTPPPKKSVAVPVFRKSPADIPKAIDLPEKAPVVTPATKNFLQALLPGLALFFLKK